MFKDASEIQSGTCLTTDVCIVGGGAAGIAAALALAAAHINVILVESGGLKFEQETQALYEGEVAPSSLHSEPHTYRRRMFGGSTTIWGGRCVPLDPIDFERREYVPHSGWPISRDTLAPYYQRANDLCEAGKFAYTVPEALPDAPAAMIPGFESDAFRTDSLERFSCPTDFGRRYHAELVAAAGVTVLLHANCVRIGARQDGRSIDHVVIATASGKRFSIRANNFVLATGGLEVPRLLLASNDVHHRGLGNQHDLVGRFYMCHVAGTVGILEPSAPSNTIINGYDISPDGIYCRRRLTIAPETQRQLEMLNFVARLHHPSILDPSHGNGALSAIFLAQFLISYEYSKRLRAGPRTASTWLRHIGNVVTDPIYTSSFLLHWLRKRTLAKRKFPTIIVRPRRNRFALDFNLEQVPNPDSRVQLTAARDRLGMPKIEIDWRYSAQELDTTRRALRLLAAEFERSGAGRLSLPEMEESELFGEGAYGGHHIGTARMAASASQGVVDANCRVHGIENLFIAGSAVFPTSGHANPTLTLVALALRLGEHIAGLARVDAGASSAAPALANADAS